MKWLKRISLVLGVIILILAVVPFFISLDDYIPQIEKEVAAKLKEPVTIKSLRAAAPPPLPYVTANGISVCQTGEVQVGEIVLPPDLFRSMFPARSTRRSCSRPAACVSIAKGAIFPECRISGRCTASVHNHNLLSRLQIQRNGQHNGT